MSWYVGWFNLTLEQANANVYMGEWPETIIIGQPSVCYQVYTIRTDCIYR